MEKCIDCKYCVRQYTRGGMSWIPYCCVYNKRILHRFMIGCECYEKNYEKKVSQNEKDTDSEPITSKD